MAETKKSIDGLSGRAKARFRWVTLYRETNDAGLVCRRCGISRPTLRKWLRRFDEHGIRGLSELSRRPKKSPNRKVNQRVERLILGLRERRLGVRRIQNELLRKHDLRLALATIQKVLARNGVSRLRRRKRKKAPKTYEKDIPGERVQMDTCKIAPRIYQFTAVDDCTRYRVLGIYKRRTAENTLHFLHRVIEEMPFPVQRIQTDRGREFFAEKVQRYLMEHCIKFRPTKPRSPHLNGKVERSQRTDLDEFYETQNLRSRHLEMRLFEWQHFYHWQRPHESLQGKTPMEKYFERALKTPCWNDVESRYDITQERIRDPDYHVDTQLQKVKQSV